MPPIAVVSPEPMAPVAKAPVIPKLCKVANVLPAATAPIPDWIEAATEPAAIPAAPKPNKIGVTVTPSPIAPKPARAVPIPNGIFN